MRKRIGGGYQPIQEMEDEPNPVHLEPAEQSPEEQINDPESQGGGATKNCRYK